MYIYIYVYIYIYIKNSKTRIWALVPNLSRPRAQAPSLAGPEGRTNGDKRIYTPNYTIWGYDPKY